MVGALYKAFLSFRFPIYYCISEKGVFLYPVSDAKTGGYDRVSTMFSPKGRLYQVEYASKIVEQGTTGIGLVYNEGILLGAEKHIASKLVLSESIEKIFKVDTHIGAISSGLVGDARLLVKIAREKAQENNMMYEEPIQVETPVNEISAIKQAFTQYGGMRPFGVSFIFGGLSEDRARIFETEPSGALAEYRAVAIGRGKKHAMEFLEEKYKDGLDRGTAIKLVIKALQASMKKEPLNVEALDFAFIEEDSGYVRIPLKDLKTALGNSKRQEK